MYEAYMWKRRVKNLCVLQIDATMRFRLHCLLDRDQNVEKERCCAIKKNMKRWKLARLTRLTISMQNECVTKYKQKSAVAICEHYYIFIAKWKYAMKYFVNAVCEMPILWCRSVSLIRSHIPFMGYEFGFRNKRKYGALNFIIGK